MIHYHGGPITPDTCALKAWKGRHAFISFAHPGQINLASEYCQSFALDNGAFTAWKGAYAPASKETRASLMVERIEQHNSPGSLEYCEVMDRFNMQLQLAV